MWVVVWGRPRERGNRSTNVVVNSSSSSSSSSSSNNGIHTEGNYFKLIFFTSGLNIAKKYI